MEFHPDTFFLIDFYNLSPTTLRVPQVLMPCRRVLAPALTNILKTQFAWRLCSFLICPFNYPLRPLLQINIQSWNPISEVSRRLHRLIHALLPENGSPLHHFPQVLVR
jgi:hypothetical protein